MLSRLSGCLNMVSTHLLQRAGPDMNPVLFVLAPVGSQPRWRGGVCVCVALALFTHSVHITLSQHPPSAEGWARHEPCTACAGSCGLTQQACLPGAGNTQAGVPQHTHCCHDSKCVLGTHCLLRTPAKRASTTDVMALQQSTACMHLACGLSRLECCVA